MFTLTTTQDVLANPFSMYAIQSPTFQLVEGKCGDPFLLAEGKCGHPFSVTEGKCGVPFLVAAGKCDNDLFANTRCA